MLSHEHREAQFAAVFPFDGDRCNRIADTAVAHFRLHGGNL
jgi:hypothetical protein